MLNNLFVLSNLQMNQRVECIEKRDIGSNDEAGCPIHGERILSESREMETIHDCHNPCFCVSLNPLFGGIRIRPQHVSGAHAAFKMNARSTA
jgi:hypothetical protein